MVSIKSDSLALMPQFSGLAAFLVQLCRQPLRVGSQLLQLLANLLHIGLPCVGLILKGLDFVVAGGQVHAFAASSALFIQSGKLFCSIHPVKTVLIRSVS